MSSFVETKKYSPGTTPSPWNFGSKWPTHSWRQRVLTHFACSALTVRDRKRSSITLNKNSAQAFQRAIHQGSTPALTSSSACNEASIAARCKNQQSTVRTAHTSVHHCAQLSYTTLHRTVLIIFPLILRPIIIAQMMSTGGEGEGRLQVAQHSPHSAKRQVMSAALAVAKSLQDLPQDRSYYW